MEERSHQDRKEKKTNETPLLLGKGILSSGRYCEKGRTWWGKISTTESLPTQKLSFRLGGTRGWRAAHETCKV